MLQCKKKNVYIVDSRMEDQKTGGLEWHLLELSALAPFVPTWSPVPYQNWRIYAPGTTLTSFQCGTSYPLGSALHQPNVG